MATGQKSVIFAFIAVVAAQAAAQRIGKDFAVGNAGNVSAPDVAYSSTSARYLAVWQAKSGSFSFVRGQRLSHSGTPIGGQFTIAGLPSHQVNPAVAWVRKTNRFLVVWQEGRSQAGPWDIRCRSVHPVTGATSALVGIATGAPLQVSPDVAGDQTTVDDEAVVVWHVVGSGIRSAQVTVPALGNPSRLGIEKTVSTSATARRPAISKSGGPDGRYVVAYDRFENAATKYDIYARELTRNAFPVGAAIRVASGTTEDTYADVDGNGLQFFVVWQRRESLGSKYNVIARAVRTTGGDLHNNGSLRTIDANPNQNEIRPAVSYLGPKFAVAWSHEAPSGNDMRLRMFDRLGLPCGTIDSFEGPNASDLTPSFASRYSGQSSADDGFLVFASISEKNLQSRIRGQRVQAIGGGDVRNLGGGCGAGGTLTALGPFAVGNTEFRVRLSGASPASTPVILNLTTPGPPLLTCGRCQISSPLILFPNTLTGGISTQALPVPCDPGLVGLEVQLQYYVPRSSQMPCAGLDRVSVSNRLSAKIGQ